MIAVVLPSGVWCAVGLAAAVLVASVLSALVAVRADRRDGLR